MQLVLPALEFPERVPHQFPPPSITLAPIALSYWTSFEEQYCGGWSLDDCRRLRRLASVWVDAHDPHEAARQLTPLCSALGFPALTGNVTPPKRTAPVQGQPVTAAPQTVQPAPAELTVLLATIDEWLGGKPLANDVQPRQLLYELVKASIPWHDITRVPAKERQYLLRDKGVIEIEGQRSRASGAIIRFSRDEETADLIRALARFHYLGKNSWNFEDAERFKRTIAVWLRRHTTMVIDALCPRTADAEAPIAAAIEFLSVAYVLGQRKRLPVDDFPKLAEALLQDFPTDLPERFSAQGSTLVAQIQKLHPSVREMLVHEVSIPQGSVTTCNFIDPRRVLRVARDSAGTVHIRRLTDDYHRDFWGHRYQALRSLPPTDTVWEEERDGLRDLRDTIASLLQADAQPEKVLQAYCNEVIDIKKVQLDTRYALPHAEFDVQWAARVYSQRVDVWCNELRRAHDVLNDRSNAAIAVHAPEKLQELKTAICVAEDYMDQLIEQVRRNLEAVVDQGDPDQLLAQLTTALGRIVRLNEEENP